MELSLKLQGRPFAEALLKTVQRSVDPVLRGTLNTTVTATRRERFTKPLRGVLSSRRANRRMVIKRARRGRMDARLIPSGSGIPVTEYSRWGFDAIDKTRARVWVVGLGGKKVAAGFVNPGAQRKLPLSTRSQKIGRVRTYTYKRALGEALAPSVAYWFKRLAQGNTLRWTNAFLRREFERRIKIELAKGPR
ncbi:MAG: hypothetical protein CVV07_07375 [Gammaproteobacteria bacterium HGW-Gammaproteobacteria-11]|nr:MAG: hypothetical protein CVV07_07375 [Gammaproteobacteria bacterium HGW-Gammaproteobacteria-11]